MSDEQQVDSDLQPPEPAPVANLHPIREIVQPFIDLVHAPRALWGLNVSYLIEGFVYFGMVTYLTMFFNKHVGIEDEWVGYFVGYLTSGITFSMFLFGGLADKWGVRRTLIIALGLMLVGRAIWSAGPLIGMGADGLWSPLHFMSLTGITFVLLGYGMYQPAAYAAVRQFTTAKTAGMAFAMLYALQNLGGWLPSFFSPVRKSIGIHGAYGVYTGITIIALLVTIIVLSKKTVDQAIERARAEREPESAGPQSEQVEAAKAPDTPVLDPAAGLLTRLGHWFKNHPLADAKFSAFIFILIPVQTLFAHNWLTLPQYTARAYAGTWTGDNFEVVTNFNPLLIFIMVPIVTALTQKAKVYNMMILGTLVMAAPTFLLALGTHPALLWAYIIVMTLGEAMWQPRFLQYAAEIAPEGRTGAYMGVAQLPWFLTKAATGIYSGWFMANYVPKQGDQNPESMWFYYGLIAISSTVMLILARGWLGKDFKTKAD